MTVEQCPSKYSGVQCDQIEGHYPVTQHRAIHESWEADETGAYNTVSSYWGDSDADPIGG